jgi:hypothetical protein
MWFSGSGEEGEESDFSKHRVSILQNEKAVERNSLHKNVNRFNKTKFGALNG